ncbi:hypothetical protein KFZ76_20560 [Methylovulum psychrotolerans]|uniref:hypothetical protein n=1 Tax=Methylovulum psychrotolerans TaxID=1704499 RepID=UPI001BFF65A9|nr:hypothetical protein [Methylovulum psychrotolerans]MBT9100099.1 hypothetical protein [Methylovulum psychrotolerans]
MLPYLRISLVAFLVLLQLLSPLVHAHAGQTAADSFARLHIPGLEGFGVVRAGSLDRADAYPVTLTSPSEGLVVGVHSGIKPSVKAWLADNPPLACLDVLPGVSGGYLPASEVNFSPHSPPFIPRLPAAAHSPRAPPLA